MHVNHGFSTKFLDRHWNESGTVWLFDILLDELQIHLYFICATQPSHSIALELSKEGHYLSF